MSKNDLLVNLEKRILTVGGDRKAVSDLASGKTVGDDADGLGGFILDAEDGSVSYDFRFDALLDRAWDNSLPAVTAALFD